MKNFNLYILIFLCFIYSYSKGQNIWPVGDGGEEPSSITGTIGEFRGDEDNPRFHRGTDIIHENSAVYSINDGTVVINYTGNCWTSYVRIGNIYYYHIVPTEELDNGDVIIAGTYLGEMFTAGGCALHVHLQQENVNFLDNGLMNFQDNSNPVIHEISFHVNPHRYDDNTTQYDNTITIESLAYLQVYGRTDIVVDVSDSRLNELGNVPENEGAVAPYDVAYRILNDSGEEVIEDYITYMVFDAYPNNDQAEIAFNQDSNSSNFEYIVTNNPFDTPYDRFWNTRLKEGINDNWDIENVNYTQIEASTNEEARFKEDTYIVHVRARDIDNAGIDNSNIINDYINITIDNFRPYIKEVNIAQVGGIELYNAEWIWDEEQLQ